MDLNASLREITGDPPPSRIDLDALIRAEERRGYRQRRLVGAGVVSGVAVLVGAASVGWPLGSRAPIGDSAEPPCPWVSPSDYPSFRNSPLPSHGSATLVPPPPSSSSVSPFVSPSDNASPFVSPSGGASSLEPGSASPPPSVGHSGSPAAPPPSTSASVPVSVPGAGPSAPVDILSVPADRSPAESCSDTLRRLEHVLRDSLARIAPNAHPAAPIRFFNYPDGTVRSTVVFDGGGKLVVVFFPRWRVWHEGGRIRISVEPLVGPDETAWYIGTPALGLVAVEPAAGPLTLVQLQDLGDEPGLTPYP